MKTLCYSVRLESFVKISEKCFKATAFDGGTALIPVSQYFGRDFEVQKSDAYWITAWVLNKCENLQWSNKKKKWFDH